LSATFTHTCAHEQHIFYSHTSSVRHTVVRFLVGELSAVLSIALVFLARWHPLGYSIQRISDLLRMKLTRSRIYRSRAVATWSVRIEGSLSHAHQGQRPSPSVARSRRVSNIFFLSHHQFFILAVLGPWLSSRFALLDAAEARPLRILAVRVDQDRWDARCRSLSFYRSHHSSRLSRVGEPERGRKAKTCLSCYGCS